MTLTVEFVVPIRLPLGMERGWAGRTEESSSFPTIEETVVVREGDDHDRADDDLAVDDNGALLDRMHTYRGVRNVVNNSSTRGTRTGSRSLGEGTDVIAVGAGQHRSQGGGDLQSVGKRGDSPRTAD